MSKPIKIIRACTVPASLSFVHGLIPQLTKKYDVMLLSSPGHDWNEINDVKPLVKCEEIAMSRQISIRNDVKSLIRILKVFRRERPTMVHSMTPKAGLLCMLAAWMTRVPVRVHTFTGLVFPTSHGLKKRILMLTDWLTCACATHVIPEGEGVKRDLLNNGITRKNIKVLGYGNCKGIDLEYYNPNLNYDLGKDSISHEQLKFFDVEQSENFSKHQFLKPTLKPDLFTFIVIGRLVGDKGINELISAFERINTDFPQTRLILLGHTESKNDPLEAHTVDVIRNHKSIEAVGLQYDVRPWMAVADCAVLASYREGFPNVVIEAGAMGLPQIVTDINGANEIIIEGKNGTIIPPRNTDALYQAMRRMIIEPEWRKQLADNARELIVSRYDKHYVQQCLLDFYEEILPDNHD